MEIFYTQVSKVKKCLMSIVSPFQGVISNNLKNMGNNITQVYKVLKLYKLEGYRLEFSV